MPLFDPLHAGLSALEQSCGCSCGTPETPRRACQCSCSAVMGRDCQGTVRFYPHQCTDSDLHGSMPLSACTELPLSTGAFTYTPNAVGQCLPSQAVVGALTETDPFTICCASG